MLFSLTTLLFAASISAQLTPSGAHNQPTHNPPEHNPPEHNPPGHNQPVHGQPTHNQPTSGQGTLVTTTEGIVQGSLVTSTVRQWLGIPFAAPPTGTQRFGRPQPPLAHNATFTATQFGNSCFATLTEFLVLEGIFAQQESLKYDEDCLNLNIWAPATNRPQGGAVMIWIYGGGDIYGSSDTPLWNGATFVENHDDLVIVSFNYRSNIFGFPGAPQQTANLGLLDRDAAIQWVHANIAAFGGDPNRITLFGNSAGSMAADAYAFSHPNDTIVKGIILQSGTVQLTPILELGAVSPTSANSSWNTVATAVGCGSTTDATQFACMQAVPMLTLLNETIVSRQVFAPFPDEETLFSDVSTRSANGEFLKVPLLIGTNLNEGDIFVLEFEEELLGSELALATTLFSDLITEIVFLCPAVQAAGDRLAAAVPTWRYVYEGVFPDINNNTAELRSYHTAEIPSVFGTFRQSTFNFPPTANEIALSAYMQSAWVAFARNPVSGLTSFGWPNFSTSLLTPSIAALGNSKNPAGVTFSPPIEFDVGCNVVEEVEPVILSLFSTLGSIL
ncbi:alpha/beta-hydrolase [Dacryopinax primogenitus]|uniref:Carboxylic ester hydrolase n=1 Tax=Dacryopinax primogenitus (strain DJM 731) TaxID=1858805 RepID=M5G0Z2_DACPD|nr:alpha/beta-hydrolase [Dacryopinax primogenitus]EJU02409.1 alpha/beta-hydrolase [Dacryopinax primogenitus]